MTRADRSGRWRGPAAIALPTALAAIAAASCTETGARYYRPIDDYPKADAALGEKLAPGEAEAAARIAAIIEAHLRHMYGRGAIYRDAHPKADGCVKAVFAIDADIAPALSQGLFETAKSYDAVIRFSNGNEDPRRSDAEGDGRGWPSRCLAYRNRP